jgi:hypothetical protein
MTGQLTAALQVPFQTFPAHDASSNVAGVSVLSFFAETTQAWPQVVCRLHPSAHQHTAIGNVSAVEPTSLPPSMSPDPGVPAVPPGTLTETVIDPAATLELRIGARSEVERERLMDWAYRALLFHEPAGVLGALGTVGINVLGLAQEPVLPDIDPTAPRPQGMPPWPGQLFFSVQVEYSVSYAPLPATTQVALPTVAVTPLS